MSQQLDLSCRVDEWMLVEEVVEGNLGIQLHHLATVASEAFLHRAWGLWVADGPEAQLEGNPVTFAVAVGLEDSSSVSLRKLVVPTIFLGWLVTFQE